MKTDRCWKFTVAAGTAAEPLLEIYSTLQKVHCWDIDTPLKTVSGRRVTYGAATKIGFMMLSQQPVFAK